MTRWIDNRNDSEVGDVGFLVNVSNHMTGLDRYDLRGTPAHTNGSHMPKLYGWCGSYNDTATHARGLVKIVKVTNNGRAKVETLKGQALEDALEELGYPDLDTDE